MVTKDQDRSLTMGVVVPVSKSAEAALMDESTSVTLLPLESRSRAARIHLPVVSRFPQELVRFSASSM